jgi:nitrite reductase (NO-forming)
MKNWIVLTGLLAGLVFSFTALAEGPAPKRDVSAFTLKSETKDGKRLFVGVGGKIDGKVNPTLFVKEWEVVEITLVNMDGLPHHVAVPDFFIISGEVKEKSQKTVVSFVPFKTGGFSYYCGLEGHRQLGMEGQMVVIRQ